MHSEKYKNKTFLRMYMYETKYLKKLVELTTSDFPPSLVKIAREEHRRRNDLQYKDNNYNSFSSLR